MPVGWPRALDGEAQSCGMWRVCEQGKVVRETALVMRLRRNGVVVLVPRFGIEGTVFMVEKTARGVCVCGELGCGFVCVSDHKDAVIVGAGASAKAKRAAEEMFEYDAVAQTLTRKDKPSHMLKVFDAVRDAWVARHAPSACFDVCGLRLAVALSGESAHRGADTRQPQPGPRVCIGGAV